MGLCIILFALYKKNEKYTSEPPRETRTLRPAIVLPSHSPLHTQELLHQHEQQHYKQNGNHVVQMRGEE